MYCSQLIERQGPLAPLLVQRRLGSLQYPEQYTLKELKQRQFSYKIQAEERVQRRGIGGHSSLGQDEEEDEHSPGFVDHDSHWWK
jgi:hypothetical protein